MITLQDMYEQHEGKMTDKWTLYLAEYERVFNAYRNKPISLLEIGIQNGGSLEIWANYFKSAQRLVGCDIEKKCDELVYDDDRIQVIIGDANSSITFERIKEVCSSFNIIIDDGSHRSSDIVKSFMRYFPLLEGGGVYAIEDLHCSYWQEYEGGLYDPYSSISFLRQLIDFVNKEHWGIPIKTNEFMNSIMSHYHIEGQDCFSLNEIDRIEFTNSMCLVHKKNDTRSNLGTRVVSGNIAEIAPKIKQLSGIAILPPDQSENIASLDEYFFVNRIKKQKEKLKENQILNRKLNKQLSEQQSETYRLKNKNANLDDLLKNTQYNLNKKEEEYKKLDNLFLSITQSKSWRITAPLRMTARIIENVHFISLVRQSIYMGGGIGGALNKALLLYRQEGYRGLKRGVDNVKSNLMQQSSTSVFYDPMENYLDWIDKYDQFTNEDLIQAKENMRHWSSLPKISVVMPTYNPKPKWLEEAIGSIVNQIYPNWELCIADDCSSDPLVKDVLKKYKANSKIKVVFREKNGHISAASNSAITAATGDWIALLDHDDYLPNYALYFVAKAIVENRNVRMIYSDEDKINENGQRHGPYFKTDWNLDLFYSHNMFSHLGVYSKKLLDEIGGFRLGMEGSQDYDLALRCIERLNSSQIFHVPRVLYHWRIHGESTAGGAEAKPYAMVAGERALNEHFERKEVEANVKLVGHGYRVNYALPKILPLVSIIVPTRNYCKLVKQCINSVFNKTIYDNYEIIVIDNGSNEQASLDYFEELKSDRRIKIIRDDCKFNYSRLNNLGVAHANGKVLVLLNNDIEVIEPEWLSEMVSMALQPDMGAIGAKLLYSDNTIQHAGVILGMQGIANHAHRYFHRDAPGYYSRAQLISSFSAVTAACLAVEKRKFLEVGGLDQDHLQVAYNDVDFCLKLRSAGYRNVLNPYALLYHHESATRGYEMSEEKRNRLKNESEYMVNKWSEIIDMDPMYSPNLTLENSNFSLAFPPRRLK